MPKRTSKLDPRWIQETRDHFLEFLDVTEFPHPDRNGTRGSAFEYPEWLIMFIAVLSVQEKLKNYQEIHRFTEQYWDVITRGYAFERIISESSLRNRLKKIRHCPRKPAAFIFQIFPEPYFHQDGQRR